MLSFIVNFFKSLNSNSRPEQIANSFCIGLILGFMPKNNLLWFIVFVFFAFVRINKCGYGIMILLGSIFAPLENIYAFLLDLPLVGFTKFNNTVLSGSLICGLLAYIPLFVLLMLFIKLWRSRLSPALNNSRIVKAFYRLPLAKKISSLAAGN